MSTTLPPPLPPPLPELDAEAVRRELAGLRDPDGHDESRAAEYRDQAVAFGVCLCRLYDVGKRIKLWDRVESAITTVCAKVQDGDTDRALSLAASHVMAEPARAAHNDAFAKLMGDWSAADLAWRQGLIRYMAGHVPTVVTRVRYAWQPEKERLHDEAVLRRGQGTLSNGEVLEKGGDA